MYEHGHGHDGCAKAHNAAHQAEHQDKGKVHGRRRFDTKRDNLIEINLLYKK